MAFTPISNTVPQYEENGVAASGYFIKFYESGTTTPTAMATDSTGTTLLDKCELNTEGYPINGSSAVFIPHINKKYKIALFRNAADADANDLNNAAWDVDGLFPYFTDSSIGTDFDQIPLNANIVYPVDTIATLRELEPTSDGQRISLLGHTLPGVGSGVFYHDELDTTSDDDNGTVVVTPNGKRWKRGGIFAYQYTPASWFGVVGDVTVVFSEGWVISGGTDQGPKINAMIAAGKKRIQLPSGWIRCDEPIEFVSGTDLIGESAFNDNMTSLVFAGGPTESALIESASIFEVSHYSIKKLRTFDGRQQLTGVAPTAGYGVKINNAVNSQVIKECFFSSFPDGPLFIGADNNSRAGDNVDIDMLWVDSSLAAGIQIGNLNNTCSIQNIFCDGVFPAIERINGNQLACVFNLNAIKHENGTSTTIKMFENDRVVGDAIISRGDSFSSVIEPISNKGTYTGIKGTSADGTTSFAPFKDGSGDVVSSLSSYQKEYGLITFLNSSDDEVAKAAKEGFEVSGLSGVREQGDPRIVSKKVARVFLAALGTYYLEISTDVTAGAEIAGDIAMHFIGDRRGAAISVFSCREDGAGGVSQADSTIIGGGGLAFGDITMGPPEALVAPEAGKVRIPITNTHATLPNFLSLVVQVSVRNGSMVL